MAAPPPGVDGEEGGRSRTSGGTDCSCDGVGDVVEFEIEEDVEAAVAELLDDAVADGVVELHADLEPSAGVVQEVDEFHGLAFIWEVQRDGEAVFGGQGFSLAAAGGRLNTDFHR